MKSCDTNGTKKRKPRCAPIALLILFSITLVSLLGIRRLIYEYKNRVQDDHDYRRIQEFNALVRDALEIGKNGIDTASYSLQKDIKEKLDLSVLKTCMNDNLPYPEFDNVLRDNLQYNAFTKHKEMDNNRNNIFVLVNGNIVASYGHTYDAFDNVIKLGSTVTLEHMIREYYYNKELSLDTSHKLNNQYKDLLVWQSCDPGKGYEKYDRVNLKTLDEIFIRDGFEALSTYEILIPTYITDYGNIFGDVDIPGSNEKTNKIIIVQKLNIVDWINYKHPGFFTPDTTDDIEYNYNNLSVILNIFILINCMSVLGYGVIFMASHNTIVSQEDRLDDKDEIINNILTSDQKKMIDKH